MMPTATMTTSQNTVKTPQERLKILLIEDNPGDARLVEILLEDSDLPNVHIEHRLTFTEGVEEMLRDDYAVVLLDLTLPDSRGFETLERLIAAKSDVNVVVMTGLADKVLGLNAVKAGAQDFLMKGGFDSELLAKTLRYAIERKNVLTKLAAAQRAREVAEESAQMKEQFIASISHEMRTPMNAIYGMSNLLAQTNLDGEQTNLLGSIKQSSEVLLGIINDILEISTLKNGKMHFENKRFDLHDILTNLVNVMQYKKAEKSLEFQLAIDPSVPQWIVSDKLRLNQILFNVVGNSVKFTDDGFVKIYTKTRTVEGESRLLFVVQDSGIGIPAGKLDAIFESFTRVRTKDRIFEGTGLGLAIVKNLVTQMDGRVWAESELGVGSTFFIDLPLVAAQETAHSDETTAVTTVAAPPQYNDSKTRHFSLLLVEDHKMNQIVARKTLERQFENIKITIAENGRDALDLIEGGQSYDIILLDIQMPKMDGNETIAYIRQNMPQFATPVLAMTAHAYISKDNIFKNYGFDDFVLKPFEPEQLFSKIHYYIETV